MIDRRNTSRLLGTIFMLLLALCALGCRLVFLHVDSSEVTREKISGRRRFERTISDSRGKIVDRRGLANTMALDLTVKDIIADPVVIIDRSEVNKTAGILASSLGIPLEDMLHRLARPGRRYERVARLVPEDSAIAIAEMDLTGIRFEERKARCYPQNQTMCHVLGFVNHEGVGSAGVEQSMNSFLRGCPGLIESKLDGRRHELHDRRVQNIPARPGANVSLTLDQRVQYIAEKALDNVMTQHNARAAWAIVQRVATGEILAMASRPGYDPNRFNEAEPGQLLNRPIGHVYEPGSTMKIITIAAALNEGIVTPDTVMDCENGAWLHCGKILHDYHPYGKLTVANVVKKSSNIGTAKLGIRMGKNRLGAYLFDFGMGASALSDLPGEEVGLLRPVRKWSPISTSRISIGQGISVTAVQMLNAACAIANDGLLMRPYVVKRITAPDGEVVHHQGPQVVRRVVTSETAAIMRKLLARVTETGGTGRRARVPGYVVAGKTGTAQKVVDGIYSHSAHTASFVGFLPAGDPELGIIVVVDEPQPIHVGGVVAGPVFKEIAGAAMRCLDLGKPVDGPELLASRAR